MTPWLAGSATRFAVAGLANTLAGLAIIYAAKWWLRWDDLLANVVGYGAGIGLSFFLNKRWTFSHVGDTARTFLRFLAVLLAAYLANLLTLIAALHLGVDGYVAQGIGVVPYTLVSYLGSKQLVFVTRTVERKR